MQFLETLLLPEVHEPHPFVFFKVIHMDENPFDDMPIKSITLTSKKNYSPVIAKVAHIDIFDDELMFTVKSDDKPTLYSVSTRNYYIMENDEIEGDPNINVEIGDDAENELIQLMKDPSIKKKIPQELKDYPRFKRKVDAERTKGRVRVLDTIGDRTRTVDLSNTILSHDNSHLINEFILGKTKPPEDLQEAILEKSIRLSPKRPISTPDPNRPISTPDPNRHARQTCKESNCSISGGKRKRNRTRKNKKKRYGRF